MAVSKACRYEPELNPTYQDMALHYQTAILPARPRKPQDKAKVESGVQVVEQEILAALRHQTFFSLGELNEAIWRKLEAVNARPLQKMEVSRRELFLELDKPALKDLPATRYEYAEFHKARVNIDYHIEVRGHYYSVPFQLRGQQVEARLTVRLVEVLHRGRRVASHVRLIARAITRPILRTCPRRTRHIWNGHPAGSSIGQARGTALCPSS